MPNSILLFVPLLAGYWFQRLFYWTKFRAQSLDGYKLVLQSILFGSVFGFTSRLLIATVKTTKWGHKLWDLWGDYISHDPYSGTALLSMVCAFCTPCILNSIAWDVWVHAFKKKRIRAKLLLRLKRQLRRSPCHLRLLLCDADQWKDLSTRRRYIQGRALRWATLRQKNPLLVFLSNSALSQELIVMSLKNRKYYVGYVTAVPTLHPDETYMRLLVMRSGYRHKDTLRLVETNDYNQFYLQSLDESKPADLLSITVPVETIEWIATFNSDAYGKLQMSAAEAAEA